MSKSIINYLVENEDKFPLSTEEHNEIKSKFGNNLECSFAKNRQNQFYCYTHRARSKFYDKISDIPKSKVDFIGSTG